MRKSNPKKKLSLCELAQIAMMLEVCCKEKPGNVDRCHDYDDTALEHFLASTIFAHDVLLNAEYFGGIDGGTSVNLRPEYPKEYRDDFLSRSREAYL